MKKNKSARRSKSTRTKAVRSGNPNKNLVPLVGIFLGVTVLFFAVYFYSLQVPPVKAVSDDNAAVVAVKTFPAVETQLKQLSREGVKVGFKPVRREDGNWNVQMYEMRQDRNVTTNWFVVNSDSGNLICSLFDLNTNKMNNSCSL